ncbi:MAG: hypothetical protein M1839_000394 [Geoglossum umbratile]|nr:MAG: hypothetical protein M1839_000394 [Geoglossum umbratile]
MERASRHDRLPVELTLWPALQVGVLTGTSGLVVGGVSGLIRSSSPMLFAAASGIQWFALGSTFWATRGAVLHAWGTSEVTPKERMYASGIAGAFSGATVGLLTSSCYSFSSSKSYRHSTHRALLFTGGRANALPGAIMFSIFGLVGQGIYNFADARHSEMQQSGVEDPRVKSTWENLLSSRWSPVKALSDKEYEQVLEEKLLRLDAEIALIDEDIAKLKESNQPRPTGGPDEGGKSTPER